jgi:hypothetical protein
MDRRPPSAGAPPAGRVTLTLHGSIGELAAARITVPMLLEVDPV